MNIQYQSWFLRVFIIGAFAESSEAGSHAGIQRRDDNSSSTELVSVTPTQTSNTLHPSITPPPNFNLALTKGPLIFGEPSECHNVSFINSLSKWIGNQTIEDNPCRKDDNAPYPQRAILLLRDVGSVQLFYFPPVTANVSYPSTVYMSHLDYTFTSPSVYMVWSTIRGYNRCGTTSIIRPIAVPGPDNSVITTSGWLTVPNDKYPVGPTLRNVIYPLDLTQVSSQTMRLLVTTVPVGGLPEWHPPGSAALTLSNLYSDCSVLSLSSVYSEHTTLDSAAAQRSWSSRMAKDNRVARCNPYLMIPGVVLDFGMAWWKEGIIPRFNSLDMPDPPYAITRNSNLQPTAPELPATFIKPFTSSLPMPVATRTPGSAPTAISPPQNGSPDPPSPIGDIPNHDSNPKTPSPADTDHRPQGDSGVAGDTDGSKPNVGVSPNNMDHDLGGHTHTAGNGDNNGLAGGNGSPNSNNPTVSAVSVAVIGTEVISVVPGEFTNGNAEVMAYILPGGATLQPGSITTLRANDGKSVALSAGTKGTLVVSTIGDSRDTTFSAPVRNDVLVQSLEGGVVDPDPYVGTLVNSMINKGSPGQTVARISTAGGQILFASPASTPSAGLGLGNGAVSESGSSNGGSSSEGNLFRGAGTDNSTTSGSGALESGRCYAVIWGIIGILLFP